jgi:predicted unusual protein kinase regulating ubiquinone biosynthesis (AarF/ABC1/UbiB family)
MCIRDRDGLRELLIGVGTKDVSRIIKSYQMMNILLPGADIDQLEQAGLELFELFWGRNMSELTQVNPEDVIKITKEYRQLIYSLPIQIPQNIIFLGRTIGILSGICTGLDPEFNLFDHLAPYTQQLIVSQIKPDPTKILQDVGIWLNTIYQLPHKIDKLTSKIDRGEISVKIPEVNTQLIRVEDAIRSVALSLIFVSFLLGGIQLKIANEDPFAYALLGGASVLGIVWLWGVIRR